jgi:hypothetical protein
VATNNHFRLALIGSLAAAPPTTKEPEVHVRPHGHRPG